MSSSSSKQNVILFPFMAQGHLIPYLALALKIQSKFGYTLQKSLPPNNSNINLVSLPYCSSHHNLPPNSENTDVLPYTIIINLFDSSHLVNLSTPPLCIISDMFFGWTVEIAKEFGIFHSVFVTGGAYGMAIYYSIRLNQPQLQNESEDEFLLPDFPQDLRIHRSQLANNVLQATGQSWVKIQFGQLDLLVIMHSLKYRATSTDLSIQWLDGHEEKSVLYVSFGSQNTISSTQMMELAIGLEKSGKSFIWVVRPPLGYDINGEFRSEWLPEGFEERMKAKNRGLVMRKWAPQLEIFHCGWNSILESLSFGVPIIGWPISADQYNNSKLLEEEIKVCVELGRGNRNEIRHEDVVRVIDFVMSNESKNGAEMRTKACEVKAMIENAIREDEQGFNGSSLKRFGGVFCNGISLFRKN
ncbi:hypothetical protein MKX01_038643 [Papaver californicum]|nr:hypothetical protein MKX01_038643 [Papaver californicum]